MIADSNATQASRRSPSSSSRAISSDSYYPTIENTFTKEITYKGQKHVIEIVDTAGQDEYSILNSKHFIGIHGYVLVYSVASMSSFEMVQVIRDKILNHLVSKLRGGAPASPSVHPLSVHSNLKIGRRVDSAGHRRQQERSSPRATTGQRRGREEAGGEV